MFFHMGEWFITPLSNYYFMSTKLLNLAPQPASAVNGTSPKASLSRRFTISPTGDVIAECPTYGAADGGRPRWKRGGGGVSGAAPIRARWSVRGFSSVFASSWNRISGTSFARRSDARTACKTHAEARGSVYRGLENIEYACGIPSLLMGDTLEQTLQRGVDYAQTHSQPLGVCAGITPFNFPVMVPLWTFPVRRWPAAIRLC